MRIEAIAKHIAAAAETAPKLARLAKATQDVEAIFLKDLLKVMRRSAPKTDLGGQGMGKEIYEDLMDQALAETASKRGTFGIATMLYKQLAPTVARAAWAEAVRSHKGSVARNADDAFASETSFHPACELSQTQGTNT